MTEKVVKDVDEDAPVVASEETETAAVEETATAATTTEEETPAVESSGDAAVEVAENGNGEAEVAEPVVEDAGKFFDLKVPLKIFLTQFFIAH